MREFNRAYRTKPNHLSRVITALGQAGYSVDMAAKLIVQESTGERARPVIGHYNTVEDVSGETLQITVDTCRAEGKDLAKVLDELRL